MNSSWYFKPTLTSALIAQLADEGPIRELLEFQAPWEFHVTVSIFLVCFLAIVFMYMTEVGEGSFGKRVGLASLRIFSVGLLLFMLYRATSNRYQTDRPRVAVVLDNSKSMDRRDATPERSVMSRFDQAKDFLLNGKSSTLARLCERYDVSISTLDRLFDVQASSSKSSFDVLRTLKPACESSPIGNRVNQVLRSQQGRGVAAIVLLTDGNSNVGISLSSLWRRTHVPITCVGFGREKPPIDVELLLPPMDDSIFLGDTLTIQPSIEIHELAGRTVQLSLLRNRDEEVATIEFRVESDFFKKTFHFEDRPPEPGPVEYEIVATEFGDEENQRNNRVKIEVLVKEERLKVLLLQATPNYEFRMLKNTLERVSIPLRSENWSPIELTAVLQDADLEIESVDRSMSSVLPTGEEGLSYFDVIIFGDVDRAQLPISFESDLVKFVREQGRGVIFVAGENFTPLTFADSDMSILFPFPVTTVAKNQGGVFTFRKTPVATTLHLLDAFDGDGGTSSDSVYWRYPQARLRSGVRTLAKLVDPANGNEGPGITLHYSGKGRVLFHFFDGLYLLKQDINDVRITDYWLQVVRFLGRHKLGTLTEPKIEIAPHQPKLGEPINVYATFPARTDRENSIYVHLVDSKFRRREIRLNRDDETNMYSGQIQGLRVGDYRLALGPSEAADAVEFSVVRDDLEQAVLTADFEVLRKLARETGGHFYPAQRTDGFIRDLETLQTERRRNLQSTPIWNSLPIALLFLCLLSAEWILRRRNGMA